MVEHKPFEILGCALIVDGPRMFYSTMSDLKKIAIRRSQILNIAFGETTVRVHLKQSSMIIDLGWLSPEKSNELLMWFASSEQNSSDIVRLPVFG